MSAPTATDANRRKMARAAAAEGLLNDLWGDDLSTEVDPDRLMRQPGSSGGVGVDDLLGAAAEADEGEDDRLPPRAPAPPPPPAPKAKAKASPRRKPAAPTPVAAVAGPMAAIAKPPPVRARGGGGRAATGRAATGRAATPAPAPARGHFQPSDDEDDDEALLAPGLPARKPAAALAASGAESGAESDDAGFAEPVNAEEKNGGGVPQSVTDGIHAKMAADAQARADRETAARLAEEWREETFNEPRPSGDADSVVNDDDASVVLDEEANADVALFNVPIRAKRAQKAAAVAEHAERKRSAVALLREVVPIGDSEPTTGPQQQPRPSRGRLPFTAAPRASPATVRAVLGTETPDPRGARVEAIKALQRAASTPGALRVLEEQRNAHRAAVVADLVRAR